MCGVIGISDSPRVTRICEDFVANIADMDNGRPERRPGSNLLSQPIPVSIHIYHWEALNVLATVDHHVDLVKDRTDARKLGNHIGYHCPYVISHQAWLVLGIRI